MHFIQSYCDHRIMANDELTLEIPLTVVQPLQVKQPIKVGSNFVIVKTEEG